MAESADVVVIGAGAVGLCCALELARSGRNVVVLTRDEVGIGCSLGNSGLVLTSVCGPLAEPGAIGQSLRAMRDPDAAFRMRLRADTRFVRWLWNFRRCCTREAWRAGLVYTRDLIRAGRPIFEQLAKEAEFGYRHAGVLALFKDEASFESKAAANQVLAELDITSQQLDRKQVRQMEPRATDQVVGGFLFPEDAHLNPRQFLMAMAGLAQRAGVRIVSGATVSSFLTAGRRISQVVSSAGNLSCELVVLAAGAWSPNIARRLRLPLLIEAGKGYSLTRHDGEGGFVRPVRLGEIRTVVTPMGGSLRITAKLDLVGLNLDLEPGRWERIPVLARDYVRLDDGFASIQPWSGLRPLTPDGYPLLGFHPAIPNLLLATGHGYLGLALSTITGRLVSRLAANGDPGMDIAPMHPARFTNGRRAGP